jgi:hypothetical protein
VAAKAAAAAPPAGASCHTDIAATPRGAAAVPYWSVAVTPSTFNVCTKAPCNSCNGGWALLTDQHACSPQNMQDL